MPISVVVVELIQFLALALAVPSCAGFISLETKSGAVLQHKALLVSVTVANHGDEEALNLDVRGDAHGLTWNSGRLRKLGPGRSFLIQRRFLPKHVVSGRYIIAARLRYTDPNHIPFVALAASSFFIGHDAAPDVAVMLKTTRIDSSGRLDVKLTNLDDRQKNIRIRLVLPEPLSADSPILEKTMLAHEETRALFNIRNLSAPAGSSWPVYAIVEYELDHVHHTAFAESSIEVIPAASRRYYRLALAAAALGLIAALITINARTCRGKK